MSEHNESLNGVTDSETWKWVLDVKLKFFARFVQRQNHPAGKLSKYDLLHQRLD